MQELQINPAQLKKLAYFFKYEHFKKDEYIFKFGDEPEKFYLIIDGLVSVQQPNPKYAELQDKIKACHSRIDVARAQLTGLDRHNDPKQEERAMDIEF